MKRQRPRGLFITGTDTEVGKTHVGCMIARSLAAAGKRVGVYKPAASGCRADLGPLVSDDAMALWNAAGRPGELERVCPQCFAAPVVPHLAAQAEGREIDAGLLRSGLNYWLDRSDIVLVEGAGGLMSPLGEKEYIADLAFEFGFPLVIVTPNTLGAINRTLSTLIVAVTYAGGMDVAAVVLNEPRAEMHDESAATNLAELKMRCVPPVFGPVSYQADEFDAPIDWFALAREPAKQRV